MKNNLSKVINMLLFIILITSIIVLIIPYKTYQNKQQTIKLFEACGEGCNYQLTILQKEANTSLDLSEQSLFVLPCWQKCADKYISKVK